VAMKDRQVPVLDEATGCSAPRALLRSCLTYAPAAFLAGAIRNPELGLAELLLLLRNCKAPAAVLTEIGRDRRWSRLTRVQHLLALHPETPLALGLSLLRQLWWKELVEVSLAPQVKPLLRRLAEKKLMARVERMTLGQRIALARRAARGMIANLAESDDARVLAALLGNPYLVEADAVRIASGTTAPPELLERLAGHHQWGGRHSVRLALALNTRTPVATALGIVRQLSRPDLRRLCRDPDVPRIVCIGAERRLDRGPASAAQAVSTEQDFALRV